MQRHYYRQPKFERGTVQTKKRAKCFKQQAKRRGHASYIEGGIKSRYSVEAKKNE